MNYCFGDFEFTCGRKKSNEHRELLSAGLVFYDIHFNEICRYYRTAKPVFAPKLSDFCKKLTGLTQEEINASADSNVVGQEILALLDEYEVDAIYAMGVCDPLDLRVDAETYEHQTGLAAGTHPSRKIADYIVDIQPPLKVFSRIYGNESIGIQKFLDFYDISVEGELHNSFVDAYALAQIYKRVIFERDVAKTEKILVYEEALREREIRQELEREQRRMEKLALTQGFATGKACHGYIALRKDTPEVIEFRTKKERKLILSECQGISCQIFDDGQEEAAYLWAMKNKN